MKMRNLVVLLVVQIGAFGQTPSGSKPPAEAVQIVPPDATKAISSLKNLSIYLGMRPAVFHADFDGDGKPDIAIWVEDQKGNRGLWVKLSSKPTPIVLGCGYFDTPWKDWRFDEWMLFRKWQPIDEPVPLRDSQPAPRPVGDYLVLSVAGSGSITLYWDGARMKTYSGE